jgi:hypothetical protein
VGRGDNDGAARTNILQISARTPDRRRLTTLLIQADPRSLPAIVDALG